MSDMRMEGRDGFTRADARAHLVGKYGEKAYVIARYDGQDDEGFCRDVKVYAEPEGKSLLGDENDHEKLVGLFWQISYDANPGYEINEGGRGIILWDLATNKMIVRHEWMEIHYEPETAVEV